MFGTLGGPELFLIFVVALIVFGPRKLPEIGKSLGKMMAEFRKASNDFRSTIESEVEAEKIRESMRIDLPRVDPAPAPAVSPTGPTVTSEPAAASGEASPATDPTVSGYPDTPAAPEEPPGPSVETAGAPVPDTVSRGAAGDTPVEPK
jgi:Tat protein translocase TatB subunit